MNLNVQQWISKLNSYITSLTLYEQLAWGAIIFGSILIIIGLLLF